MQESLWGRVRVSICFDTWEMTGKGPVRDMVGGVVGDLRHPEVCAEWGCPCRWQRKGGCLNHA